MIFRFCFHILEDALLPEPFHQVPIVNCPMTNGVLNGIGLRICYCLISNEEIEVLDAAFRGQVPWLIG